MHLQHLALVAWATSVTAALNAHQPRLAVMPLPGLSLARRDTNGYKPETKDCSSGNTCEEACGAGFDQCTAKDDKAHCYNKGKGDTCCMDGSGNSCETGYYCTSDPKAQNWCCPKDMDLATCASAYRVDGGLQMATAAAAPAASSAPASAAPPAVESPKASAAAPKEASAPAPKESSEAPAPMPTDKLAESPSAPAAAPATTGQVEEDGASAPPQAASSAIVATSALDTAASVPSVSLMPGNSTRGMQPPNITVSTAASTSISALLIVAAGMFALL